MEDVIGVTEVAVRLAAFVGVFALLAAAEVVVPRRSLSVPKLTRWFTNLAIVVVDSLTVRAMAAAPMIFGGLVMPLVAVAAALYASQTGIGLFNAIELPVWVEIIAAMIILDYAIWLQHWISHKVPMLWRLHLVHHADRDFDVTTALRFHPVEIALSMLYKIVWVLLLGPAVLAVVLFEITLNACAMFNHANLRLPSGLDRALRLVIVTPDMHRVHHSIYASEHNANYGFSLSIWDRLFATYVPQPRDDHDKMTIGLPQYQTEGPTRLGYSLLMPFQNANTKRELDAS